MVDSQSSLYQRIQARLNKNNTNNNNNNANGEKENESESDIDDDVTLDECVDIVKRKSLDSSFTKVLDRGNAGIQSSVDISLREVVAKRKKNEQSRSANSTAITKQNGALSTEDVVEKDTGTKSVSSKVSNNRTQFRADIGSREDTITTTATTTTTTAASTSTSATETIPRTFSVPDEEHEEDSELPCAFVRKQRVRLTEEEKQEAKRRKEQEKLEKQKKREEAKVERELEKLKEKAAKKANTLNNRSERKDECMEKMLVVIDPGLIEGVGGADILKSLQEVSVSYEIKSLPISRCIGWMKENATFTINNKSEVLKTVSYDEEKHMLHVITANELAIRVQAELDGDSQEETLSNLLKELKEAFPNKKFTILFTGLKAYYRLFKTNQNREFRNQTLGVEVSTGTQGKTKRKKKTFQVPVLEKKVVEGLLVEIQTMNDIFFRRCEDEQNVGEFVASFTKAIAEAPFKKTSNSSLQFCAIAPNDKQSVKIMDDGRGVHELWNQQLQQFYGVRHETSVAITQRFPTPRSLMEAYRNESAEDGPRLLQDLEVRRGVGVLQTQRRVGPELSKRVYKLMTSTNGEEPLAR